MGWPDQPQCGSPAWSLLRGSPRMPRLSATRSKVPSNRITSGASAADEHRSWCPARSIAEHPGAEATPGHLVGLPAASGSAPHPGGLTMIAVEPGPGDPVRIRGDLDVHLAHRSADGQVSGGVGDLAADPRLHLPGLDPGPQTGQPVPQVQRGRDQPVGGVGGDPEHRAELGGGELRHLRRAGTAEPEQTFTPRQRPAARLRPATDHGVQVGPWAAASAWPPRRRSGSIGGAAQPGLARRVRLAIPHGHHYLVDHTGTSRAQPWPTAA